MLLPLTGLRYWVVKLRTTINIGKQFRKHVIVVPDRDEAGQKLVWDSFEAGWSVSMPDWDQDVKDVNDAVCKYGRLHTLYTIIKNAEDSQLKTKLRMKKWFT